MAEGERKARMCLKRQPRVLLIDLGAHFGGVENYLVGLAGLLAGEVELHALCVLPELAKRLEEGGAKVTLLPVFGGALKPARFLLTALILPIILLRDRIDMIQVNGFLEATLMMEARLLGRRAVYTRHGPFELELFPWYRTPLKFLPRALARISVHLATQVVCVSETIGIGVKSIRPAVPAVVIPNWVAGQSAPQIMREGPGHEITILCASRLERYKGIHLAISAVGGVPGARLIVAGDGPYRNALEAMSTDLIASGKVEFAGFQKNMQPYYELADVFCMPSLGPEGLPMSSLEAMSRGLPCILSDLPVHREITDDGVGAMLFASGDERSLQQAMTLMATDRAVRAKFAGEGYRIIGERYTAERVRGTYLEIFARIE